LSFFSSGLGYYKELFTFVEQGQHSINNLLQELNKSYKTLEPIEQFKIRFFLREFLNQIELLHKPIHTVLNKLQKPPPSSSSSDNLKPQNISKSMNYKPKSIIIPTNSIHHEVDRLSSIISKLEKSQITLNFKEQLKIDKSPEPGNVIFSREIHLLDEFIEDFMDATKTYILATKQEPGCLFTYLKRSVQKNQYDLYSVWVSMEHLSKHYLELHYRAHCKAIVDLLVEPERINRMTIPTSWVLKSF